MLDLTGKRLKHRKLSGANAYSKLNFKTKIMPVVQERWRDEYLAMHPGANPSKLPRWPIRLQNAVKLELWEAEPDEVKDDVRERFGLHRDDSDSESDEVAGSDDDPAQQAECRRVARAKEYQRCVPDALAPSANDSHWIVVQQH